MAGRAVGPGEPGGEVLPALEGENAVVTLETVRRWGVSGGAWREEVAGSFGRNLHLGWRNEDEAARRPGGHWEAGIRGGGNGS